MKPEEMKERTKNFGIRVIRLVDSLPRTRSADVIGRQVLRSGTSVGANYRSACRGRSRPDFISKIGIAIEEADESLYWMEILVDSGLVPESKLLELKQEAHELISIMTASSKTAYKNELLAHSKTKRENHE